MDEQEILSRIGAQIDQLNAMAHSTNDFYLAEGSLGHHVRRGDMEDNWPITVYQSPRDLERWLDGYIIGISAAYQFTLSAERFRAVR